ncbi:MAG: hemerythrin domain-containing protein [Sulfuricellaceae bacterium]|nr:hemerythrin domain-containing protein [Sulfuricellaceae bacterium]
MTTISDFLAPDHQRCDHLFAAAEAAVASKDWNAASVAFEAFRAALLHHFSMEEEVMFPTFEERTGMSQGPTQIMRMEHLQMIELLDFMADSLAGKDTDGFLGDAETLLIIMQQHNVKEEQMLYRMADQALSDDLDNVIERMQAVQ